ncbi:RNA polymerase sigma-70 factor [Leptobacterium flavescens]|uniref:RNA polymerase sigma-70 factor n=1 Tax=Leptobacterium flavescens TaxID=472055 RepID=A0A6P0UPL6_9FLAO|nr:RNA polymerase sigma-70 factor [Leptobacterium flavescens]NER13779.1 RNA polymerase sigma-70 factor [Leptobacterium flavescens]
MYSIRSKEQTKEITTEIEAVKALKQGNKYAFKHLFERYYQRLVAYIMSYNNNQAQAEDIVQQAYIRLWENRNRLDEGRSPKHYLYAIAYNNYIDSVKKDKRKQKLLNELWERALQDRVEEDTESMEKRMLKLRSVIDALPPRCREVIRLNKISGAGYKEIAERLSISVKTVEYHMCTAYKRIREAFEKDKLFLLILIGNSK